MFGSFYRPFFSESPKEHKGGKHLLIKLNFCPSNVRVILEACRTLQRNMDPFLFDFGSFTPLIGSVLLLIATMNMFKVSCFSNRQWLFTLRS